MTDLINFKYLNLKTQRRDGRFVATPVWFADHGGAYYIRTYAGSGKVKRACNFQTGFIAPCKSNGTLLGDWVPATIRIANDETTNTFADELLDKKYGWFKKLFELVTRTNKSGYTTLVVYPTPV